MKAQIGEFYQHVKRGTNYLVIGFSNLEKCDPTKLEDGCDAVWIGRSNGKTGELIDFIHVGKVGFSHDEVLFSIPLRLAFSEPIADEVFDNEGERYLVFSKHRDLSG